MEKIDEKLVRSLSETCQGSLAPLCATLGGFVAQEALKAVTGKFTPLNQWVGCPVDLTRLALDLLNGYSMEIYFQLFLDSCEVMTNTDTSDSATFQLR